VCQPGSTSPCVSLAWSPTGRDLLWSDARGLWQTPANPTTTGESTQLIHPNKVTVKDPKGQNVEIEAHFTELQFSPSERFILLKVTPLSSPVGWQAVFDRRSGQIAQALDTFVTGEDQAQAIWGSNGNLIVAHASDPGRQIPPFIHVWFVMPTNSELLVSGQQFDLYSDNFPFSTAQSKAVPSHRLHWLAETPPDHLTFAVQLDPSDDPPVLFNLNLLSGSLTMLSELPADTTRVLWSPDGQNALVLGGRNQVASFSLKTGELSDLQSILGLDAHQFAWMPPVLRR
jgi:hypothetical protein